MGARAPPSPSLIQDACSIVIATQQNNVPFQWVKYAVYLALLNNVYLFLVEELDSAAALNTSITSVASVFQIFSTTIDTAAWLVLLLFFELETSVLSDQVLRGITGRFIRLIRFVCLITICIACWGYFAELYGLLASEALDPARCGELDSSWSLLNKLDEYESLSVDVCAQGEWVLLSNYDRVVAAPELLQGAIWLAATDFINAAAWILVVAVLEVEVRAVLAAKRAVPLIGTAIYPIKSSLYFVLFAAAVYWGFEGDFLDFWDAVLWLFAFFVIEQNVTSWRQETVSS